MDIKQPLKETSPNHTMSQGWIKLHRQILDTPITTKPKWAWLWIVLLLLANHEDKEFIFNGENRICKRGQLLTGRKALSKITNIRAGTVEDILKYLENQHQIQQQKTNKFRLITILKYNQYQENQQENQQQANNKATTKQQQADTNKNEKNEKNSSNEEGAQAPKEYGNPEVNKILEGLKAITKRTDFKESARVQRQFGQHFVSLLAKLGKEEFRRRLESICRDTFKAKNIGSLKYLYGEMKSVPTSNPSKITII